MNRFVTVPLVLACAAVLAWAGPAYAVSYGSKSSPVKASDNSDNGNAWFYGNVTVADQVALRNGYFYRDSYSDGNPVYVQTNWYYWLPCTDGKTCFDDSGSDQSPRIGGDQGWVHDADYDDLDSRSDKGRALTKVCEDQAWSPDPCSKNVTITLGY